VLCASTGSFLQYCSIRRSLEALVAPMGDIVGSDMFSCCLSVWYLSTGRDFVPQNKGLSIWAAMLDKDPVVIVASRVL
jgi:hypothetical protein